MNWGKIATAMVETVRIAAAAQIAGWRQRAAQSNTWFLDPRSSIPTKRHLNRFSRSARLAGVPNTRTQIQTRSPRRSVCSNT